MNVGISRSWSPAAQHLLLPLATLAVAPTALAQTPSAPAAPATPATPAAVASAPTKPGQDADSPKKRKKRDQNEAASGAVTTSAGRIELKGRVFALAELRNQKRSVFAGTNTTPTLEGVNSLDLSIASARVGLEYEAPLRWISAVAELELTDRPELKDGYVQARGQHLFFRMGQFKLPVSALATDSPWNLPLVRRGLVHDLLTEWLDVGDRRPGLLVGWRGRGGLRPRFMLGAFQGTAQSGPYGYGDRDVELLEKTSLTAQSYVARAQFEPGGVQLGAWYQHRLGSPDVGETQHYFTAGIDAVVDHLLASGGVRAWVEATTGASWYEHAQKAEDGKAATFVEARALVGYRFGGTVEDALYLEPFGFLAVLEPDTAVRSDSLVEAAVGVNAGFWQRARLTLQGEIVRAQRNFPDGLAGYLGGEEPGRLGLLLQAGVAW